MDLYSGLPYWIVKNPLYNYYNPLVSDYTVNVAIIGTGITGALVAHELCKAGIECCMIDKRSITTGSSVASTALLQYEIDTPLCEMTKNIPEPLAVKAYQSCLQSITDIENVFKSIGFNPDFKRVPSLYYASNWNGYRLIKREYKYRQQYDFPTRFLDKKEVKEKYGIQTHGALENHVSAQIDAYKGATHLIDYHMKKDAMKVFSHTEVTEWKEMPDGYQLLTTSGATIHCNYVVIAAGFEAGQFLPEKVMKLTSTYAVISEPIPEKDLWQGHGLIWETHVPYLYIRTDGNNRIIVGGEDENFRDPVKRDKLLRKKTEILEKKMNKLFPSIPFKTEMAWCGTFSDTEDGLPYIGSWPGKERMLFALGYGGNGITFSMIGAQMIRNKIQGYPDDREDVFGFGRYKQ